MTDTKTIGWGIIGCGDVARKRVAAAIQEDPHSKLIAACRRDAEKLAEFCRDFDVAAGYQQAEQLIADPAVDAVYIATPVDDHRPSTLAAAAAGKHVLVEKPMGLRSADCAEMIAACQAAGVKLGVAYYRQFYSLVARIDELVQSGRIGKPLHVTAVTATPPLNPEQEGYWRTTAARSGGGALMDIGSHRIQLFQYLFGEIAAITGFSANLASRYETEDTAVYSLRFESGLTGTLQCHFGVWSDPDSFTVLGTDGRLHARPLNGDELIIETAEGTERERLPAPANLCGPLIRDFSTAIIQDREPAVNGEQGMAVNRIIEDAYWTSGVDWVQPEPTPTRSTASATSLATITVNGRSYRLPRRPVTVICIDGCEEAYLNEAIARGRMPHLSRMIARGFRATVCAALPSFTNVNNCAIVSGVPPAHTGIAGNFMLDPQTGDEVMTNSSKYLRCDTILAAAAAAGRQVAMVTAKDKLRELLAKGLDGISFSAEKAAEATEQVNRIADVEALVGPAPPIYSADASLYVLRAGVRLLEAKRADFLYLSLTDYMQHKFAPEEAEVLRFYGAIDDYVGQLLAEGTILAATADHGMNAKCDDSGKIRVVYLEELLREQFGEGCRVICPITDPYVVHHGALGSAVMVHLNNDLDVATVADWIRRQPGITEVLDRETAATQLELPADRIGELFVLSARNLVIGRRHEDHDLSQLDGNLRSHGGRYEEMVPLLLSEPVSDTYWSKSRADPRNFDVFDFVCNGITADRS